MKRVFRKKTIAKGENNGATEIVIEDKVSIAACRKILKIKTKEYTDEQVRMIRDFFYRLAVITYEEYEKRKTTIVISST